MPQKRRNSGSYHHGNLRPLLLEIAAELVDTKGRSNFSLSDIAKKAGVSQSAPYRHFKNRSELLNAVALKSLEELQAEILHAYRRLDTTDPVALIRAFGRVYLEFGDKHRGLFKFLFSPSEFNKRKGDKVEFAKVTQGIFDSATQSMRDLLAQAQEKTPTADEVRIATVVTWGLIHGLTSLLSDNSMEHELFEANTKDVLFDRTLADFLTALGDSRPSKSDETA